MPWTINNNKTFFFKISSKNATGSNGSVTVSPSRPSSVFVNSFNVIQSKNIQVQQTGHGDVVSISQGERVVNFIFDQSGSMSWSDPYGTRYDTARSLIENIQSFYPNKNKYNIFQFGGKRAHSITRAISPSSDPFIQTTASPKIYQVANDGYVNEVNMFGAVRIIRNSNRKPQSAIDGQVIYHGSKDLAIDTSLQNGKLYNYKAYVFSPNGRVSKGVDLSVSYSGSSLVDSVGVIKVDVFRGTGGFFLDSSSVGVWHFNKYASDGIYDFVGKNHFNITNSCSWLTQGQVPVGFSGLKFLTQDPSSVILSTSNNQTVSLVGNYATISFVAKINNRFFVRQISSNRSFTNYQISVSAVDVSCIFNGVSFVFSGALNTLTNQQRNGWLLFSVLVDNATGSSSLYINGSLIQSVSFSPSNYVSSSMIIQVGGDSNVSDLSVYRQIKDQTWISSCFSFFNAGLIYNTDTVVSGSLFVSPTSNYIGGKVFIAYGRNKKPHSDYFRQIDITGDGWFYFFDSRKLNPDQTYYYSAVSYINGAYGQVSDSVFISPRVPVLSNSDFSFLSALQITSYSSPVVGLSTGRFKNYISWKDSGRYDQVRIYWSDVNDLQVSTSFSSLDKISNGKLLFAGDASLCQYFHESLVNDKIYYYAVVFSDGQTCVSIPSYLSGQPSLFADQTDIPIRDVVQFSCQALDVDGFVRLNWKYPYSQNSYHTMFNGAMNIHSQVYDDYGQPVDLSLSTVSYDVQYQFYQNKHAAQQSYSNAVTQFKTLCSVALDKQGIGQINGSISFSNSSKYLNYSSAKITVIPKIISSSSVSNSFSYSLSPVVILASNPVDVQIQNFQFKYVDVPSLVSTYDSVYGLVYNTSKIDGYYSGTSISFKLALDILNTVSNISNYPISSQPTVVVYRAVGQVVGVNVIDILPDTSSVIQNAIDQISGFNVFSKSKFNSQGQVIGLVDVQRSIITFNRNLDAGNYLLYVSVSLVGYKYVVKYLVSVKSTVQINIIPSSPIADGSNRAQLQASVFIVDPDNTSNRFPAPDGTVVQWAISQWNQSSPNLFPNSPSRSLTSSYNQSGVVVLDGYVASETVGGVSGGVYLGPVSNIQKYTIDGNTDYQKDVIFAVVSYDGHINNTKQIIKYTPVYLDPRISSYGNFLIQLPNAKQNLYTDSVDYVKITISNDPSSSSTKYSQSFNNCSGGSSIQLQVGDLVSISSTNPNVKFYYGNVTQYTGAFDRKYIDTTASSSSVGSVDVPVSSGLYTYAYMTLCDNSNDQQIIGLDSDCGSCGCSFQNQYTKFSKEIVLTAKAASSYLGQMVILKGGGSMKSGIPPTVVVPVYPLKIRLAQKRRNNIPQNDIVIDGLTSNVFVFQISQGGYPVMSGTNVYVSVSNILGDAVSVSSSVVKTVNIVQPTISNIIKSYAYVTVNPIPYGQSFKSNINVSCTLAQMGISVDGNSSNSQQIIGTECSNFTASLTVQVSDFKQQSSSHTIGLFSDSLRQYNGSEWRYLNRSFTGRVGHSLISDENGRLFMIGGMDSNIVLSSVQIYNVSLDSWSFAAAMKTPRFAFQCVFANNKIYAIGGLSYDYVKNTVYVTTSVQVYDIALNTWSDASSMPSFGNGFSSDMQNGVAFGSAIYNPMSGDINVFCGINNISQDGKFVSYNKRVLAYNTSSNSWYSVIQAEVDGFSRIGASVFQFQTGLLQISGGVFCDSNKKIQSYQTSLYFSQMFGYFLPSSFSPSSTSSTTYGYKVAVSKYNNGLAYVGGQTQQYFASDNALVKTFSGVIQSSSISSLLQATSYASSDSYDGKLYVSGGLRIDSNQGLIVNAQSSSGVILLNGQDHSDVLVSVFDSSNKMLVQSVSVSVKAYLQHPTVSGYSLYYIDPALIGNVIQFKQYTVSTDNGYAMFTLMPRSSDIISKIESVFNLKQQVQTTAYKIVFVFQARSDSGLYGKSDITISSSNTLSSTSRSINAANNGYISSMDANPSDKVYTFNILPWKGSQGDPLVIDAIQSGLWIPFTKASQIGVDSSTAMYSIQYLKTMKDGGQSPVFDSIKLIANESLSGSPFFSYLLTDGDENSSTINLQSAIVQSSSLSSSSSLSVLKYAVSKERQYPSFRDGSWLSPVDIMSQSTGSRSVDIYSYDNDIEIRRYLVGQIEGGIGRGDVTFIVSFSNPVSVQDLKLPISAPLNVHILWRACLGINENQFGQFSQWYGSSQSCPFNSEKALFAKIQVIMQMNIAQ